MRWKSDSKTELNNMANNYAYMTPERELPCSEADANHLQLLLEADCASEDEEHGYYHGLRLHYWEGKINLCHDDHASYQGMSRETTEFIGQLIDKAGCDYWQFGLAFTCDKARCGEFGGGYIRIHKDGSIEEADLVWAGGQRHWLISGRVPGEDEDQSYHVEAEDEGRALEYFIHRLYPDGALADEQLLDDDDFVLENPTTGRSWVNISSMFEISGPPIQRYA